MSFACPEAVFQASTPEDCFEQLKNTSNSLVLSNIIEMMCGGPLDERMQQQQIGNLGPLNLFALTSGKLHEKNMNGGAAS